MSKRNILISGATSGLGLELVRQLRDKGYTPILTGRNAEKVQALAQQESVVGYLLDVGRQETISSTVDQIIEDCGPLWGAINNAGIWLEGDFIDYTAAQINEVINTNMTGTIMLTHKVLPSMIEQGSGTILNVISTGALYCRKSISIYSASKWAIRGFTGCLEVECAPKGVRVLGFYPGKIDTQMYETAGVGKNLEIAMSPEQGAQMAVTMIEAENMIWSHVSGRSIQDYV